MLRSASRVSRRELKEYNDKNLGGHGFRGADKERNVKRRKIRQVKHG